MKELKEYTYDELVEGRSNDALSSLMLRGGKGLHDSIYMTIELAIRWYKETRNDNT